MDYVYKLICTLREHSLLLFYPVCLYLFVCIIIFIYIIALWCIQKGVVECLQWNYYYHNKTTQAYYMLFVCAKCFCFYSQSIWSFVVNTLFPSILLSLHRSHDYIVVDILVLGGFWFSLFAYTTTAKHPFYNTLLNMQSVYRHS